MSTISAFLFLVAGLLFWFQAALFFAAARVLKGLGGGEAKVGLGPFYAGLTSVIAAVILR